MNIPVVCYYTKDSPYEQEFREMRASAESVGLNVVHSYAAHSKGSWVANCGQKSSVLLWAALFSREPSWQ